MVKYGTDTADLAIPECHLMARNWPFRGLWRLPLFPR